jgi:mono/diheme cytochrome c family protein
MKEKILAALLSAALLAGCSNEQPESQRTGARQYDTNMLALGQRVFQNHCAVCHGPVGEAKPGWQKPGPDGKLQPPPLDDNGRTWRLSTSRIKQFIRQGSPGGRGNMPAWQGKLTEQELDAVVTWITSLWSDAIYMQWQSDVAQEQNQKAAVLNN